MFGTDDEHKHWMRLADDGGDKASRDRGRGYRDGLSACGEAAEGSPLAGSTRSRGSDLDIQANRVNPRRR
jgi:hypothetical protein